MLAIALILSSAISQKSSPWMFHWMPGKVVGDHEIGNAGYDSLANQRIMLITSLIHDQEYSVKISLAFIPLVCNRSSTQPEFNPFCMKVIYTASKMICSYQFVMAMLIFENFRKNNAYKSSLTVQK
jgi:hypothetical protein